MGEARPKIDDVWALARIQFPERHEGLRAIVPWGGDRAVIVTDDAVYLAETDDVTGYRLHRMFKR